MSYTIQFRNDTAANWATKNTILAAGEAGFDTTNLILKIGTGATAWSSLQGISLPATAAAATPGIISQFAGSTAPAGYLLCQGQEIAISAYPDLHAVLGTTYGALTNGSGGAGTTHFRLPNLQGRIPVGRDASQTEFDVLGETGGAKTHTLTTAEMPSHTHNQNSHNHDQNAHNHGASSGDAGSHAHTASTNTAGSHTHADSASHTHAAYRGISSTKANSTTGSTVQSTNVSSVTSDTTTATTHVNSSAGGHSHTVTVDAGGSHSHTVSVNNATATNQATTATNQNTGGGGAHNNLQPYIVVNYIIKT